MGKRSNLTVQKRREVVLTLLRREEPAAKLARRFGVSEHTLYRWRDDCCAERSCPTKGASTMTTQWTKPARPVWMDEDGITWSNQAVAFRR
ncbi:MAG: transposase [Planctomycetota bacterium]|jgi:transposase-like protein